MVLSGQESAGDASIRACRRTGIEGQIAVLVPVLVDMDAAAALARLPELIEHRHPLGGVHEQGIGDGGCEGRRAVSGPAAAGHGTREGSGEDAGAEERGPRSRALRRERWSMGGPSKLRLRYVNVTNSATLPVSCLHLSPHAHQGEITKMLWKSVHSVI